MGLEKEFDFYYRKYERLLTKFATRYYKITNKTLFSYSEIYNIAALGLYVALQSYEEGKGTSLMTHICSNIKYKIFEYTVGRSTKNVRNSEFYNTFISLYTPSSKKEDEDVCILDTIQDNFNFSDIDYKLDIQREFERIRKIMLNVLDFDEEFVLMSLYYYNKSLSELAADEKISEKNLLRIKSAALRKLREVPYIKTLMQKYFQNRIDEIGTAETLQQLFLKEELKERMKRIDVNEIF